MLTTQINLNFEFRCAVAAEGQKVLTSATFCRVHQILKLSNFRSYKVEKIFSIGMAIAVA